MSELLGNEWMDDWMYGWMEW